MTKKTKITPDTLSKMLNKFNKEPESHVIDLQLDVGDIVMNELYRTKMRPSTLAKRLGRSEVYVEHIMCASKRLSIKEIGHIFHALKIRCEIKIKPQE